jgi:hypothetical protein
MKKYNIFQLMVIIGTLTFGLISCEKTVWPDITNVAKTDYMGIWKSQNYREKTTYIRTQDLITKDFAARDTTFTETVDMQFDLGIARSSGMMVADSAKITLTTFVDGVPKTPVVKTGYFTIGETAGGDYTGKTIYLNFWEKKTTIHTGFANPIAEPYTTYTVVSKSATEMTLSWVLYNNTAQSSIAYKVVLKK